MYELAFLVPPIQEGSGNQTNQLQGKSACMYTRLEVFLAPSYMSSWLRMDNQQTTSFWLKAGLDVASLIVRQSQLHTCIGCLLANTRPHQSHWGGEMRIDTSCKKRQVAGLVQTIAVEDIKVQTKNTSTLQSRYNYWHNGYCTGFNCPNFVTQQCTSTIQTFEGQQEESYIRAHWLSLKVADSYSSFPDKKTELKLHRTWLLSWKEDQKDLVAWLYV